MAKKIVVLGTGGTIAGSAASPSDNVGYRAGERSVQSLLDALAQGAGERSVDWVAEQVAQIDSKDADFEMWAALHRRCSAQLADASVAGLVITHGTDTLEEAAWFLRQTLPAPKPVVLTCAMRPASALVPDGPQNLLDALALAAQAHAHGVSAVWAGVVHDPQHMRKVHPYRLDAFSSGETGPLGWMEEGALRLARVWSPPSTVSAFKPPSDNQHWPWVEIVQSHAGARADAVQALVAAGVQGLVVAATGNGTLHYALEAALQHALAQKVPVRVTSKCALGAVVGTPTHGLPLAAQGLSPEKARVSLLLDLLSHTA